MEKNWGDTPSATLKSNLHFCFNWHMYRVFFLAIEKPYVVRVPTQCL